jgi:hypothetical protein
MRKFARGWGQNSAPMGVGLQCRITSKQWRLDHVRQIPELTACDTWGHGLAAITPLRAALRAAQHNKGIDRLHALT